MQYHAKKNANLSGTERGTLLAEMKADGATLVGSPPRWSNNLVEVTGTGTGTDVGSTGLVVVKNLGGSLYAG